MPKKEPERGRGMPRDFAEATKWYASAAEQGHAQAQSRLGSCYVAGQGVAKDQLVAYFWLTLASKQHDKGFCCIEERREFNNSRMPRRPTPRNPLFYRRRFGDEFITLSVIWYLRFKLSYRDLAEMADNLASWLRPAPFSAGSFGTPRSLSSDGTRSSDLLTGPGVPTKPILR
jgi:hypothetical protein